MPPAGLAYGFGVFVDQHLAGEVNLNHVLRGAMQSGTIGYWIDQARAGRGLIAESVVVLAGFAFEQLELHRLEICIVPRNTNSRRVMEKLGVREEGLAERYLEIDGVWEDHVRYGFTLEEWNERRDELTRALAVGRASRPRSTVRRRGGTPRPAPGAGRCGASTSSSSSGAAAAALGVELSGDLGVTAVAGLPCRPRLVDVDRIQSGADLVGNVLQLGVDPMPLAVGLGPQLLLRRQRPIGRAVALAHSATSSLRP